MKKILLIVGLVLLCFSSFAQQWEVIIDVSDKSTGGISSIVSTDNQIKIATSCNGSAFGYSIDTDGICCEQSFGIENTVTGFLDIVNIGNDTLFALGYYFDTIADTYYVRVVTMNNQLEELADFQYQIDEECYIHEFHGRLLVDNDGTVIATVPVVWNKSSYSHPTIASFWRFNRNGELLNSYYTKSISNAFSRLIVYDLRKLDDDSSFVAIGEGWITNLSIMFFDYDFNMTDYSNIVFEQNEFSFDIDSYYSGYQFDNQHLFVAGSQSVHDINKPHLLMTKVDLEGNIVQRLMIDQPDTLYYGLKNRMVSFSNDSTIYITAHCREGHWMNTPFGQLFLINRDMELLGSIVLSDLMGAVPAVVLHTDDDGCIVVGKKNNDYIYIRKYSREDFNPIPCSVKEVPLCQNTSLAYPNPAKSEINIDISSLAVDANIRIRVTNSLGQPILERIIKGTGNLLTLGIESLPSGMYYYSIFNPQSELISGKFVKE